MQIPAKLKSDYCFLAVVVGRVTKLVSDLLLRFWIMILVYTHNRFTVCIISFLTANLLYFSMTLLGLTVRGTPKVGHENVMRILRNSAVSSNSSVGTSSNSSVGTSSGVGSDGKILWKIEEIPVSSLKSEVVEKKDWIDNLWDYCNTTTIFDVPLYCWLLGVCFIGASAYYLYSTTLTDSARTLGLAYQKMDKESAESAYFWGIWDRTAALKTNPNEGEWRFQLRKPEIRAMLRAMDLEEDAIWPCNEPWSYEKRRECFNTELEKVHEILIHEYQVRLARHKVIEAQVRAGETRHELLGESWERKMSLDEIMADPVLSAYYAQEWSLGRRRLIHGYVDRSLLDQEPLRAEDIGETREDPETYLSEYTRYHHEIQEELSRRDPLDRYWLVVKADREEARLARAERLEVGNVATEFLSPDQRSDLGAYDYFSLDGYIEGTIEASAHAEFVDHQLRYETIWRDQPLERLERNIFDDFDDFTFMFTFRRPSLRLPNSEASSAPSSPREMEDIDFVDFVDFENEHFGYQDYYMDYRKEFPRTYTMEPDEELIDVYYQPDLKPESDSSDGYSEPTHYFIYHSPRQEQGDDKSFVFVSESGPDLEVIDDSAVPEVRNNVNNKSSFECECARIDDVVLDLGEDRRDQVYPGSSVWGNADTPRFFANIFESVVVDDDEDVDWVRKLIEDLIAYIEGLIAKLGDNARELVLRLLELLQKLRKLLEKLGDGIIGALDDIFNALYNFILDLIASGHFLTVMEVFGSLTLLGLRYLWIKYFRKRRPPGE